jgi:hypothetical protein
MARKVVHAPSTPQSAPEAPTEMMLGSAAVERSEPMTPAPT